MAELCHVRTLNAASVCVRIATNDLYKGGEGLLSKERLTLTLLIQCDSANFLHLSSPQLTQLSLTAEELK